MPIKRWHAVPLNWYPGAHSNSTMAGRVMLQGSSSHGPSLKNTQSFSQPPVGCPSGNAAKRMGE